MPLDSPYRVLDTREVPTGVVSQTPYEVEVNGQQGWPTTGDIQAVVMNATVTSPTSNSFLTIWPNDQPKPLVSNLNFAAGQTIPNQVTVKTGKLGRVNLFNATGGTHVILDIAGYFMADNSAKANLNIAAKDFSFNNSGAKPTLVNETIGSSSPYQVMEIPAQGINTTPRFVDIMADQARDFMTKYGVGVDYATMRMCATVRATSGTGRATFSAFTTLANGTDKDLQIPSSSYGQVCTNWSRSDGNQETNLLVTNVGGVPIRVKDMTLQVNNDARPAIYRMGVGQSTFRVSNGNSLYTATDGNRYAVLRPGSSDSAYLDNFDGYHSLGYFWGNYFHFGNNYPRNLLRFCAEVAAPNGAARALMSPPFTTGGKFEYINLSASDKYAKVCTSSADATIVGSPAIWAQDKPIYVKSLSVEAR